MDPWHDLRSAIFHHHDGTWICGGDGEQLIPNTVPASGFQVKFDLQNTGTRNGSEVAQVYLALPATLGEGKRLVAWQKAPLAAGEQQSLTLQVNATDSSHPLSYWDPAAKAWTVAPGSYSVYLGNSSASVTQVGTFQVP